VTVAARVLVVGLDAAEPTLLDRWSTDGTLPALARLRARSTASSLTNSIDTLPGGIWLELNSGRRCGESGFYFPARQLHTGEAEPRPVEAHEVDPRTFWTAASDAGRRVAAFDMPLALVAPGVNGLQVAEWGTHDRPFGAASDPPGALDDLLSRYGEHPVWTANRDGSTTRAACDGHDGTEEGYYQLLDDILAGIELKRRVLLELLDRESWDLFTCGFGEPQCVGHQHWHFHEDPTAPPRLANAVREVYRALDGALGDLIEAAGDDTTTVVVASHGMCAPTGGLQLIPEVLVRLGLSSGDGISANLRSRLPVGLRSALRQVVPARARRSLQAAAGSLPSPLASEQTRAVALDGDRVSWIRLNLRGREPFGCVEPGKEADALLDEIREELLALVDPTSGERIVAAATTAAEAFGPDHHPDVPDLLVSFRTDLGPIESCRSERVGVVNVPYRTPARRTGAHPPAPSKVWIGGNGLPPVASDGSAVDLAPTVLSLLSVPQPTWMAGRTLVQTS
jgi:predicted AlkP superfamily phosphohydrolase/phosphomutase